MNHKYETISAEAPRKFPLQALLAAMVILAAAAAILVFNVPMTTVLSYGFLGLMLFGHFFMHAGHGSHDHGASPTQQPDESSSADPSTRMVSDPEATARPGQDLSKTGKSEKDQDSHSGHSGCC
jgi:fatty acid desaturase